MNSDNNMNALGFSKKGYAFSQNSSTILDSSLIIGTLRDTLYNIKLVDCGDYIQVYYLQNKKFRKIKENDKTKIIENNSINNSHEIEFKTIDFKNINRSKFECQRLIKCNAKNWQTFITLTFEDNIQDISYAYEEYKKFIYKIKRIFKDFMCLCVPEFQKRGAVHYHLLTNIDINNNKLVYFQEDNKKFSHIKYWNNGFNNVENVSGNMQKIINYISKYMTKDIDDRLFSHHRYYYTRNLKRPTVNYLNLEDKKHWMFYKEKIQNRELIYNDEYVNTYTNEKIAFCEFLNNS